MNISVLGKKDFDKSIQTTLQISNKNKSDIDIDDVKAIIKKVSVNDAKVMVRALNIERWMTLKGFNDEFDAESYEDYFRNKVQEEDLEKFTKFKQLQISVIRNK
jgi:hypothetical protein